MLNRSLRLQLPVHKHEYIKGTCRYQSAMLLNEISVSDNSLGQLKIVTTNVQIMTLFGLKRIVKGECSVLLKKNLLWMKTMHYPNAIRSHLVTIVPVAPFTPKSTSKLRSALHIRYSKVIPRFISLANTAQT